MYRYIYIFRVGLRGMCLRLHMYTYISKCILERRSAGRCKGLIQKHTLCVHSYLADGVAKGQSFFFFLSRKLCATHAAKMWIYVPSQVY